MTNYFITYFFYYIYTNNTFNVNINYFDVEDGGLTSLHIACLKNNVQFVLNFFDFQIKSPEFSCYLLTALLEPQTFNRC